MMGCNDLLSLGYKRGGEGTKKGPRFAEEEVLSNCDESLSPLFPLFPCRLERLPLLCGKPVCFRQSSIALSV